MKTYLSILFIALIPFAITANAQQPTIVSSAYHTGYIPDGFDTNDNVQLVGEGMFSNTCYRPAKYQVKVDHKNKQVFVRHFAYKYDGMCLMMLSPYSQTIDLGMLRAGKYDVIQTREGKIAKLGGLNIRVAANSSADDFLYAPVGQSYWRANGGNAIVTLSGSFTNSCWKYDETKVDVQNNVIVVQPITSMEDKGGCADVMVPFTKNVGIKNLKKGRYLLHIRSSNQTAVNSLVDVL